MSPKDRISQKYDRPAGTAKERTYTNNLLLLLLLTIIENVLAMIQNQKIMDMAKVCMEPYERTDQELVKDKQAKGIIAVPKRLR